MTILGSGTVEISADRSCAGYLLEVGSERLVFDLGPGALRNLIRAIGSVWKIDGLFLSHLHPDHTADLIPYLFALNYAPGWEMEAPLRLYPPSSFELFWQHLQRAYPWLEPKRFSLEVDFVHPGKRIERKGWSVTAFCAEHADLEAYCYRVEYGGYSFCYSGDTRPCEGLEQAAKGVDLLLCECSLPRDYPQKGGHMHSSELGKLAHRVGVKGVILTHIYPMVLTGKVDLVAEVKEFYEGPVVMAQDGSVYEIPGSLRG